MKTARIIIVSAAIVAVLYVPGRSIYALFDVRPKPKTQQRYAPPPYREDHIPLSTPNTEDHMPLPTPNR